MNIIKHVYRELFSYCNTIYHVLTLCKYVCVYIFLIYISMILVHSSTVAAVLCQLPATSNPKTVGGMCYVILGMIGLLSHHRTDFK